MIREFKAAENNLSDEQQDQNGIRSLLDTWEEIRLNMMNNEALRCLMIFRVI